MLNACPAGRRAHGADEAVGDVVEPGEGARLLAAAVDRHRAEAVERLADQVGDDRVVGAAGPVGVERAADRVAEAVLGGAARQYISPVNFENP